MRTFGELRALADRQLFDGRFAEALALYTRLIALRPADLDARMRVGDALMALGEVQQAAIVYTRLAQHAAQAGYPLRALLALKVLSTLEPQLSVLLTDIAHLYGRDSGRIGRGVRRTHPSPDEPLPEDWADGAPADDAIANALAVAGQYPEGALIYPERLIPIPLLSLLPAAEFANVMHAVKLWRARPGTLLIEQGSPGHSFFVVARGQVDVVRTTDGGPEQHLGTLRDGAIFGEMALLSQAPRSATVRSAGDADLLEFDRDALVAASSTLQSLQSALSMFARERLLQNVLATSGLFRPLDPSQRLALMKRFVTMNAAPDQTLIEEGQSGKGLFVVLRGQVKVEKTDQGRVQELARLGPAEAFGEIALLSDEPTTATVTATEPTTLLFLERAYFERLVGAVPQVRDYLERISDDRQLDTRLSLEPEASDDADPPPAGAGVDVEIEVLI